MGAFRALRSRLWQWFHSTSVDREFDEELESHLEMLVEDNVRRGMTPEEARRAARLRLGGLTQLKDAHRDRRRIPKIHSIVVDAVFAFRMMRRSPGFTLLAVLMLAVGIGANTAMFSLVDALILKPLPYRGADQLFNVFQANPQAGVAGTGWSYLNFRDLDATRTFDAIAGVQRHQLTLTRRGEPTVVDTSVVTAHFFTLFDERPMAGRSLLPEDGRPGAAPVVVLSERLWRSRFGGDPAIIGQAIDLDQRPFTVVGIMPAAFTFPALTRPEQLWIPLAQDPLFGGWMGQRGGHWLQVTGRLHSGILPGQAQAELDAVAASLAREFPAENRGWQIGMIPLQEMIIGNSKRPLLLLLAAVGLVLLIACANIASLLLTRATFRAREMAVRTSLGASRGRIVGQLLTEAILLGLLGGAAGVAVASWGVHVLRSRLPATLPQINEIGLDRGVLGFAVALSVLASCAFGIAPALFSAGGTLHRVLRESGGRSSESRTRRRTRTLLAAVEVALAMILLVGAGLLTRSFLNLASVSPGFEMQQVIKADISLPRFQYVAPHQWTAFANQLLAGLHSTPGLAASAIAVPRPIVDGNINLGFQLLGSDPSADDAPRSANYVAVSPGYFHVMSIPLHVGRVFDQRDDVSASRVTVISQTMARRYFGTQNPIGRTLIFGFPPDAPIEREIVGVVGDVRDIAFGQDPSAIMYVPFSQAPFWGANLVTRTQLPLAAVADAVRHEVAELDKDLPVTDIAPMSDPLNGSLAQPRFRMILLGGFAIVAITMAAIGLFGVITYSVSSRTNEIGIRMALGASRGAILGMVLREALLIAGVGLALGVPGALAASTFLAKMLFGVSPYDPLTMLTVAAGIAVTAALAGYVPAHHATRVNPIVALRYD